jgi:hypothetical protein
MTGTPVTAAPWAARGRRQVRVLPNRAGGGRASITVSVLVTQCGELATGVPPGAVFSGVRAGDCDALPADTDEHFAVDAESCTDERWLSVADVLHGSRPWPPESAVGWVRDRLARYTGCRMAGLPLIGGGWIVAERVGDCRLLQSAFTRSTPQVGRARTTWEYSLMASCLHGLAATGHSMEELLPLMVRSLD